MNEAAAQLCASSREFGLVDNRLVLSDPDRQQRFACIIREASSGAGGVTQWMRLERSSGGAPLALAITACGGNAIVEAIDPRRPLSPDPAALREILGLTAGESRLACLIGAGHDLASAARTLHSAEETLRTQLKAIFRKAGINRQQDLMRMLAWLQPAHHDHITHMGDLSTLKNPYGEAQPPRVGGPVPCARSSFQRDLPS